MRASMMIAVAGLMVPGATFAADSMPKSEKCCCAKMTVEGKEKQKPSLPRPNQVPHQKI